MTNLSNFHYQIKIKMILTKQEETEYQIVTDFVERNSKSWYFKPKQCFNSAITVAGVDINEFGDSIDSCKTKLINRIFSSKFFKNSLLQK